MSEAKEMLEEQKKMIRDDSFCYHTNICKDGVFKDVLKNGIEAEFYAALLSKYNDGFDFEIIFYDETEKSEIEKNFINSIEVAENLSKQSKHNAPEIYHKVTEESFMEGVSSSVKENEELRTILLEKSKNSKERKKKLRLH